MEDRTDPTRRPLELSHDITPRDLQGPYDPVLAGIGAESNNRFQGYPEGYMVSPRNPLRGSQDMNLNPVRQPDGKLLPGSDEGKLGYQYGGGEDAKGVRDPYGRLEPNELEKIRQQKEDADGDIMRFKQERALREQMTSEEKKRDMMMLKDYNPWGKPGAGAPRVEDGSPRIRKEKFTEQDLGEDKKGSKMIWKSNVGDSWTDEAEPYHPFGKPGGGAPRVDPTGHVTTVVPGATDIRFRDNQAPRNTVQNQMRYMQDRNEGQKYLHELGSQMAQKSQREADDRLDALRAELAHLEHDPYGRPGAGARNPSKDERERMQATLGPNYSLPAYDPWGKGQGAPQRDDRGNVMRHRNTDRFTGPHTQQQEAKKVSGASIELGNEVGGGAPNRTDSGHVKTRQLITMRRDDYGKAEIREELPNQPSPNRLKDHFRVYDPFGRPGAGAPLKDVGGGVYTHVYGKMKDEMLGTAFRGRDSGNPKRKQAAQQLYLQELQKEMLEQKENRESMENYRRAPVGELATIMKHGQVGKPKVDPSTGLNSERQPNGTSDVTRQRTDERRYVGNATRNYHDTLVRAAEERTQLRRMEKEREREEAGYHQRNFDELWGRPGHGAPTFANYKKPLENILHAPRDTDEKYDYAKAPRERETRSEGGLGGTYNYPRRVDAEGNFVRQTVPSDHRNLFELDLARNRLPRRSYQLPVPYATGAE